MHLNSKLAQVRSVIQRVQNIYGAVTIYLEQAPRYQVPGMVSLTWNKQQIKPCKYMTHYFKNNAVHLCNSSIYVKLMIQ